MVRNIMLGIGILSMSFSALAQHNDSDTTQGHLKGQVFLELQEVLEAASDALAAAVSANTSNIEANSAAIAAEEAARQAEDAALLAKFAADLAIEAAARMDGDMALADALAAEELARIEGIDLLGTRIDALEAGGTQEAPPTGANELHYEETVEFDFVNLADDIFTLDYQAGEWLYMASTYAPSGETSALCTAHPDAYNVLVAFATGGSMEASVTGSMTFVLTEGSDTWANASASMVAQSFFLRASALDMFTQLVDRTIFGSAPESELSTNSGLAVGNTAVIRASADRMAACGF